MEDAINSMIGRNYISKSQNECQRITMNKRSKPELKTACFFKAPHPWSNLLQSARVPAAGTRGLTTPHRQTGRVGFRRSHGFDCGVFYEPFRLDQNLEGILVSVHKAHVFFRWPRTSRVAHILGGGPGKPEAKIQREAQREPAACRGAAQQAGAWRQLGS